MVIYHPILENLAMSNRQIRLFTSSDADYAAKCAVFKAIDPISVVTVEKLKFWDSWWDAKYRQESFLVEMDGQPVATGSYAEWIWWYEPGRYIVDLCVHPAFRHQGIGTALYDHMMSRMATQEPRGTIFMYKCRENQPESVRFITKRGFQQTGRELWSELDVEAFNVQQFAAVDERMQQQGITIVAYPELAADDPLCHRKCYDLQWESIQGMPATGTRTNESFEQYVQKVFERFEFIPEAFFVALDQGHYVGVSYLIDEHEDRERLVTGYTGVIPSYRRRGIATALNLCCIRYAKAHGGKTITTDTDEANPLYQLNRGLGFKPLPSELHFEMRVKPAAR
jgi:GNAT superfamily N-acetyltransferase